MNKEFFNKRHLLKIISTKKYLIFGGILIVVIGLTSFFVLRDGKTDYEYSVVEKTNLSQEVNVTGKVKPARKVDLAFESSGKVSGVTVKVGDRVYIGQTLAYLNNAQYQAQYLQAQASLDAEQSRLDELRKGTRSEEIEIQKTKVRNAEDAFLDAKINLKNYIKDSYTKVDDSIRNKVDQFITNPLSSNPQLEFLSSYELEVESGRVIIQGVLDSWSVMTMDESLLINDINNQAKITQEKLSQVSSFLDVVAMTVNGLTPNSSLTQTTIDGYKLDVITARTNINTAINNLASAKEKLRTAETNVMLERQELQLKQSGSTAEQISAQEARVKSADANVKNYLALIAKTVISSPINGVVTKKEIEVGEIVQPNAVAISVISTSQYEIETNIPEADVSKIKIGNKAEVTLDAYENDVFFNAHVTSIEPAETIIEGVSAYKSILQFDEKDERIKSGMTANIDILTDSREGVLAVPFRAIKTEDGKYVEVLGEDGQTEDRLVEVGMRSSDGKIEIISGLKEGEMVITSK